MSDTPPQPPPSIDLKNGAIIVVVFTTIQLLVHAGYLVSPQSQLEKEYRLANIEKHLIAIEQRLDKLEYRP